MCGFLTSYRKDFKSPSDFERTFFKDGISETKKCLGYWKQQESLSGAALALWKCYRKEMSLGPAAVSSLRNQRKGGLGDKVRWLVWDKLPLPTAPWLQAL